MNSPQESENTASPEARDYLKLLSYIYIYSTAVNDQIVHFYDRSLKICRITNIAEIIISRYGAKSNSILVDVMEYDMRSTRTSIVKKWEIE